MGLSFASLGPLVPTNSLCTSVHFVPRFSEYCLPFSLLSYLPCTLEICLFLSLLFAFIFSLFPVIFLVSRCSLYGALSHFLSLCPAYVLLDLTSHGTDYIFSPLSFIACFSWLVAFCFLPVFYSGGFLYKFHPLLFYVHTGFFHRGCRFATPIWLAITFSF